MVTSLFILLPVPPLLEVDEPRPDLAPGKSWVCGSFIGHRWEARIGDRPVGFYVVEPGFNWIVKDPE